MTKSVSIVAAAWMALAACGEAPPMHSADIGNSCVPVGASCFDSSACCGNAPWGAACDRKRLDQEDGYCCMLPGSPCTLAAECCGPSICVRIDELPAFCCIPADTQNPFRDGRTCCAGLRYNMTTNRCEAPR